MNGRMIDVAIVGGGLAGGLIALALYRQRPELRLALIESGDVLGGNHRWSWFANDLSDDGQALLETFRQAEWDKGYKVAFPSYHRSLSTPYRSLASSEFHKGLMRLLPPESVRLKTEATALDAEGVTLASGERIPARAVIDCRLFVPSPHLNGGWQVFMGRHIRLAEPHGIDRPVIMDAALDQLAPAGNGGAYRFVYVLPLAAHDLFIEDTYYADDPALDRSALSSRIDAYCRRGGWQDAEIVGGETGVLPVMSGGDFRAYQRSIAIPGVAVAGARGGFSHPLTSYTVPIAVENALAIAREVDLTGAQLAAFCEARARRHWGRTGFYRRLARMLFQAAEPHRRRDIFERFYKLPESLIERFYAARSTRTDKLRILCGKPPVAVGPALAALSSRGQPLSENRVA
ncbi:lycopene beta-cyclase CrtY [Altererythrobacter arenosus]|uniref:Lycopene beta-cyclase CrtY n=1 Tax=Altererythrobacter arenosus TaxID=3032592 RepID=A0ABY8FQN9_9SPHN|nr:lycopene beta-cyclase CrtY [Altererythrobacter sp. CAU 1644]WFL76218.1 lycopene beta-cyclase CrtY [Altererythrobacter sp. CAU 1644]